MRELPPGVYEDLVTDEVAGQLEAIDDLLIQHEPLDPADAHEKLTRHIAALAGRALRGLSGSDQTSVGRQVELANSIVKAISALAPEAAAPEDAVVDPARHLLAIAEPSGVPGTPSFPDRPEV